MDKDIREVFYNLEKISDKWDPYFDVYMKYLHKFIDKRPKVLEIGVQNGGSIDMWLEYFGEGTNVVGVDIDPKCKTLEYPDNVEIVLGDQADPNFWLEFSKTRTGFDVIIDDGGHSMRQQIVTLFEMWPHLNEGGIFIVEDTHTSYWPPFGGQVNGPGTFLQISKQLTDYLNSMHIPPGFISKKLTDLFTDMLNSISFYNSVVVFEKTKVKPFQRVFSHDKRKTS